MLPIVMETMDAWKWHIHEPSTNNVKGITTAHPLLVLLLLLVPASP